MTKSYERLFETRLHPYNGQKISTYIIKFEAASQLNNWDEHTKILNLILLFDDSTVELIFDNKEHGYDYIKKLLVKKYSKVENDNAEDILMKKYNVNLNPKKFIEEKYSIFESKRLNEFEIKMILKFTLPNNLPFNDKSTKEDLISFLEFYQMIAKNSFKNYSQAI